MSIVSSLARPALVASLGAAGLVGLVAGQTAQAAPTPSAQPSATSSVRPARPSQTPIPGETCQDMTIKISRPTDPADTGTWTAFSAPHYRPLLVEVTQDGKVIKSSTEAGDNHRHMGGDVRPAGGWVAGATYAVRVHCDGKIYSDSFTYAGPRTGGSKDAAPKPAASGRESTGGLAKTGR